MLYIKGLQDVYEEHVFYNRASRLCVLCPDRTPSMDLLASFFLTTFPLFDHHRI